MIIEKNQIVQFLEKQGKTEQASVASNELPNQVDTKNSRHAELLSKYGIDIGGHGGMSSTLDNAF